MTPFRVPSTGGTQIGAMWIEQQRAESCRGHGAGKGGQLAAARGGGVARAELSASQASVGALSRWGCESAAAWQLRASLQPSSPRGVSPSGARSGRQALCGLRADAGGGTLGGRRRTASSRGHPVRTDVRQAGDPHHRRQFAAGQRGGWSACTVPIRTGWSRSCGWPQSATMTMPMLICRSITSPSTIATTRDRRPLKPTIIGNVPRRDNWTTCSGWRKNECSVKTGWCVTKTACCNSRGKIVTGRRLRVECWCGRTSQDTSSFTIADRACRFAKFPWLLLRRGAEEGALPLPLQPHPRNLRLRQAGLIALLPAIILGDKAGRI